MKRFFLIRYRGVLVGEILAPAETTEEAAREIMLKNLRNNPGIFNVSGYAPFETETMLRNGVMSFSEIVSIS
jgi:hypothetical protein